MASVGEARKRLPQDFIEELYRNFSPGVADRILSGMTSDRYTTLRVNTIKYDSQSLMKELREKNIKFERVQWYNDGFIIKNSRERDLQKLEIYENGCISFQSLSSMIPPIILDPRENERVLDMTAAPGSKTTQIAAMMNNKGYILANELDKIRGEKLRAKVEIMGSDIVEVVLGRGEKLGDEYPGYFDRVLLDTPCSGEGRFIVGDTATSRYWSKKEVIKLAALQKKLFESAFGALKRGGIMVYSTCTLNLEENEEVLNWALNKMDIEILDIELKITGAVPAFSENMKESLKKAIRILPSKEMEGFFVCKLKKK